MSITKALILFLSIVGATISSSCLPNCDACVAASDPLQCQTCATAYYLLQGSCRQCPPGCIECAMAAGTLTCSDCAGDFQLGEGRCFKCAPRCGDGGCANNPFNCVDCKLGFDLINAPDAPGEKRCVPLQNCDVQNCGACVSQINDNCQTCLKGHFSIFGQCMICQFPCLECQLDIDQQYSSFIKPFIQGAFGIIESIMELNDGVAITLSDYINTETPSKINKENMLLCIVYYDLLNFYTIGGISQITFYQFLATKMSNLLIKSSINTDQLYELGVQYYPELTSESITIEQLKQGIKTMFQDIAQCSECSLEYGIALIEKCSICQEGCISCPLGVCSNCQSGFSLVAGPACQPCQGNCQTCADGDATACTSCLPPYILDSSSDSCIQCESPCRTCASATLSTCITCVKPYSLLPDANGDCFRCEDLKCRICDQNSPQVCLECVKGSNLVDGVCDGCGAHCADCTQDQCITCQDGYYPNDNGQCQPCGPGCLQCTNGEACDTCISGFYINQQNQCQGCKKICKQCTNGDSCTQFKDGITQYLGQMTYCKKGCKICQVFMPSVCLQCQPRFYLDGSSCKRCGNNCLNCDDDSSCNKCAPNTHDQGDGTCAKCQGNCRQCQSGDLSACTSCKRGYTLTNTNQCQKQCDPQCAVCDPDDPTVCLQAIQGWTFQPTNKQYFKCLGKCSGTCNPQDITECLSCVSGYQLIDNSCERCPFGCKTCADGNCNSCYDGFQLSEDDGQVICKRECQGACQQCQGDTCTDCSYGFNLVSGKCQPDVSCSPLCEFCPEGTYESSGSSTYFTCSLCSANCADCDVSQCFSCVDGYYLDSGSCVRCQGNCKKCSGQGTCEICQDGYFRAIVSESEGGEKEYSDTCTQCADQCATCVEEAQKCTSCGSAREPKGLTCFSRLVVEFLFEFQVNYQTFLQNGDSQMVVEKIIGILKDIKFRQINLENVRNGSAIINGQVQADSLDEGRSYSKLLQSGDYGYTILDSSFGVFEDGKKIQDQDKNDDDNDENNQVNVGLIVGVVLGGIALILIIGFVLYRVKKRKIELAPKDEDVKNGSKDFRSQQSASKVQNVMKQ